MTTQCDKIIRHLMAYGTITSVEAMQEYGILRLASRISDLRQQGVPIISETKTGRNRFGEPTRVAVYRLDGMVRKGGG